MSDTFTIQSDRLRATLSPHGARLEALHLDAGPSRVLHADPIQHPEWRDTYAGAIVGPVANRVRNGAFTLDRHRYQMPCNENEITALHSGPDGVDCQVWEVRAVHPARLCLALALPHGAGGLPGAREIDVEYSIHKTTLCVDIWMRTDRPTPAAFAHHPYWRLGDARAHRLQINATDYLPIDAQNLPTGDVAPVAQTAFDHRSFAMPDPHVDHNFCISKTRHDSPQPVATLIGSDGVRMTVESTEPGLQVYAGAFLPTLPGTDIAPGVGLALEPQGWPDAVNHPKFPSVLCTPEHPYHQTTRYTFDTVT
ncbi:MAG: aldose epimerase family protein [Pseudomonadota bacterium]